MKTDKEITEIYTVFRDKGLPDYNMTLDAENLVLGQVSIFNKKAKYKQIYTLLEAYSKLVHNIWGTIYTDNDEFDNTMRNIKVLESGKSLYAKTDIAYAVEQFFLGCYSSIVLGMFYYEGVSDMKQKDSNKVRDEARLFMERWMERIEKLINSNDI